MLSVSIMCCWHPYCAVGVPADAFSGILVVMSLPSAVDAVMFLLSLLLFGLPPCCCQLHFFCKHPCFYWHPYCIGDPVVAFIPAVVGVSAVPFEHAVAGGPAVNGFPAVDSILAVASVFANSGVPILAGGFTYWIVE